jgi:hypothetical protein
MDEESVIDPSLLTLQDTRNIPTVGNKELPHTYTDSNKPSSKGIKAPLNFLAIKSHLHTSDLSTTSAKPQGFVPLSILTKCRLLYSDVLASIVPSFLRQKRSVRAATRREVLALLPASIAPSLLSRR